MNSGASFNLDKTHRIYLWRIWEEGKPNVLFIGLNPSTADEINDDATIRRCRAFAAKNNFGGMYMMNLFSIVSRDPKILLRANPLLDGYDDALRRIADKCERVIFCWGGFKEAKKRQQQIIDMFPDALCFGHNSDGTPKHPLYLKSETVLIPFLKREPGTKEVVHQPENHNQSHDSPNESLDLSIRDREGINNDLDHPKDNQKDQKMDENTDESAPGSGV